MGICGKKSGQDILVRGPPQTDCKEMEASCWFQTLSSMQEKATMLTHHMKAHIFLLISTNHS